MSGQSMGPSKLFIISIIIFIELLAPTLESNQETAINDTTMQNKYNSHATIDERDCIPISEEKGSSCHQVVLYQPVFPVLQQDERQFDIVGKKWIIRQQWDQIGLSAVIWEAAIALTEYLETQGPSLLTGRSVMELGAGTGLVGMVASSLGAQRVEITDKNVASARSNLKLNSENIQRNSVSVLELEWGVTDLRSFQAPYDVILAADVIYIEDTFPALLDTLWELSSNETLILLSCKRRYDRDDRFFELAEKTQQFKYEIIMRWTKSDNVTIYRLVKNFVDTK